MTLDWRRVIAPRGIFYFPWASDGLVLLVCVIYMLPASVSDALIFKRDAVDAGQVYRLLTANFVHYDLFHLFYDVGPFLILAAIYEMGHDIHRSLKILAITAVVCCATGIWGYWGPDHVQQFAGLSAASYGMLVVAAFDLYRETRHWVPLAALALYIGRVVFGATWYEPDTTLHTWHSAHAVALAIGFAWVVAEAIQRRVTASGSTRLSTASY